MLSPTCTFRIVPEAFMAIDDNEGWRVSGMRNMSAKTLVM
jgi:hypothetical protein